MHTQILGTLLWCALAFLPCAAIAQTSPIAEGDEIRQAKVFHILLRSKSEAESLSLRLATFSPDQRLAAFSELARSESIDPSSSKVGGDLELVREGEMVKEFEAAVFSAAINQVSVPVQSPFGWHLILVTSKGTKEVAAICSESLLDATRGASGQDRSALEMSFRLKDSALLHPAVLEFMGPRWGPPLKDYDGHLGYLRATLGADLDTYSVTWHTEYVRALYNAHPQACKRSARREYEVQCRGGFVAFKALEEFEGRAAMGRRLTNLRPESPEFRPARSEGILLNQILRAACN